MWLKHQLIVKYASLTQFRFIYTGEKKLGPTVLEEEMVGVLDKWGRIVKFGRRSQESR